MRNLSYEIKFCMQFRFQANEIIFFTTVFVDFGKQNTRGNVSKISVGWMMMFETSKHVPKTEKRCCVFTTVFVDTLP